MPTKVIAIGVEALKSAQRLAQVAQPVRQGGYDIPVGTLDQRQKMLIVGLAGYEVVYLRDDKLCALPTQQFLYGYMIGDVASEVYRRTAWIIPASKIMFSFIMGVTIGYVGMAAVAVNVAVTMIRIAAAIGAHPREVEDLKVNLPKVVRAVLWLRAECPVLYGKLGQLVNRGVWEAMSNAHTGVSAEDIASMLGRILGGVAGLTGAVPAAGKFAAETGLKAVLKVVAKTLLIYSALHLPAWTAHGAAAGADQLARALGAELRAQGVALTAEEERAIAKELAKSARALSQLEELKTALESAAPALDAVFSDFAKGTGG